MMHPWQLFGEAAAARCFSARLPVAAHGVNCSWFSGCRSCGTCLAGVGWLGVGWLAWAALMLSARVAAMTISSTTPGAATAAPGLLQVATSAVCHRQCAVTQGPGPAGWFTMYIVANSGVCVLWGGCTCRVDVHALAGQSIGSGIASKAAGRKFSSCQCMCAPQTTVS